MARIAVIADSHFDEHSRFEECVRVHDWIANDAKERGVDLVLHAGDVYERRSTPVERMAVADWLRRVTEVAPVVLVRGNHDAPGDLSLDAGLRTRHPVTVRERPDVVSVAGCQVACLPWPRKAELLAALGPGGSHLAEEAAGEALRVVLGGLGDIMSHYPGPRILLSHAMVRGSMTSHGQPLVGHDLELGLEDLALVKADLYALGHIHLGQDWDIAGAPAVYPGSPRRTAYGELEKKGYLVATFDGRRLVGWERVETPCAPMILLEATWDAALGFEAFDRSDIAAAERDGAEVRLRYHVSADQRNAARSAVDIVRTELLDLGAAAVKVEEVVIAETRSRTPEIARAATIPDKLRLLWAKQGLSADRWPGLIEKAVALEEALR